MIARWLRRIDAAVDLALLGPPPDFSRRGDRSPAPGVDVAARIAPFIPADPRDHSP